MLRACSACGGDYEDPERTAHDESEDDDDESTIDAVDAEQRGRPTTPDSQPAATRRRE
jgi:hypothetical protein